MPKIQSESEYFILRSGVEGILCSDGRYYHYKDVCELLKKYKQEIESNLKIKHKLIEINNIQTYQFYIKMILLCLFFIVVKRKFKNFKW